jgi:gluconolactonase
MAGGIEKALEAHVQNLKLLAPDWLSGGWICVAHQLFKLRLKISSRDIISGPCGNAVGRFNAIMSAMLHRTVGRHMRGPIETKARLATHNAPTYARAARRKEARVSQKHGPLPGRGNHHMTHQVLDSAFWNLVGENAVVRALATDFVFTEGPIWHPRDQYLLFSDIPPSIRQRWDRKGCSEFLKPSNKGNGMTYDRDMNLLVCEHATSSVTRFSNGERAVLASHFEGKELNSPNDIVAASDGAIWFTDPTYGRMPVYGIERPCELEFRGVYRIAPSGGPLQLVVEKGMFTQPNGLCFSPDEKLLYINDTEQTNIRVFDVDGGKLKNMRVFASGISDPAAPGAPDGMKCDAEGNIWCTGPGGLWVFAPSGELIGKVAVPEFVANHHWGGPGWRTLFITASTSLYALDVKVGPHPESFMQGYI